MTSDATDPADAPESGATPPRDSRGRFTPRENAEPDAEDAPGAPARRTLAEADAAREAADAEDGTPPPAAPSPTPMPTPPGVGASITAERLRDYATRLAWAGSQPLAAAVEGYATRVEGVERGDLSPSAGANPSALTPALVGEAIVPSPFFRWPFVGLLEWIRNALIFMPVLWTWFKFGRDSSRYGDYADLLPEGTMGDSFLVWWVENGLGSTVNMAVALLLLIVVATAWLGFARDRVERRRAEEASAFAALLAEAEGVGAGRRADDPQEAIAAFASAGRSLTDDLRAVGGTLTAATRPLTDSVDIARAVMADVAAAIERQQEQIAAIAASLAGVSQVADRLGALEASFAAAQDATRESAAALDRIRASLDPRTEELSLAVNRVADLASRMERAADQIARATEDYGKSLRGFADGAEQLGEAARTMNAVAIRLRDDMAASP